MASEEVRTCLHFPLDVVDDWPPVRLESVPVRWSTSFAGYEVRESPLFVRDISIGDILAVSLDGDDRVADFRHAFRSKNSTIWMLDLDRRRASTALVLKDLRKLGCHTVTAPSLGCYVVSVPATVPMERVDPILDAIDSDAIAVVFPSFRHPESE